jgi:hypothetical protein
MTIPRSMGDRPRLKRVMITITDMSNEYQTPARETERMSRTMTMSDEDAVTLEADLRLWVARTLGIMLREPEEPR